MCCLVLRLVHDSSCGALYNAVFLSAVRHDNQVRNHVRYTTWTYDISSWLLHNPNHISTISCYTQFLSLGQKIKEKKT